MCDVEGPAQKKQKNDTTSAPIHTDTTAPTTMDEFYVGYNTYKPSSPEAEWRLGTSHANWWESPTVQLRPFKIEHCLEMGVDETLLWRILNSKRHVIISGKAGAGKSNLLERFISHCDGCPFNYALCAPTGIAAFNIGGETLHRRLGLGLAQDDPVTLFNLIKQQKKKFIRTWKFLTETHILIIDEISMVEPDFFTKVEYLFRKAKNSSEPFGGIRLIMVGDFTQLGPVIPRNRTNDTGLDQGPKESLVLDTEVWSRMNIARIFLNRSYRQADGDPFLTMLNEIRIGTLSEKSEALLLSRVGINNEIVGSTMTPEDNEDEDTEMKETTYTIKPVDIFPYKAAVDKCNNTNLSSLVETQGVKLEEFYPALRIAKREHVVELDKAEFEQARNMISKENRGKLADQFPFFEIKLAIGAQVMMRCNTYIDLGVYNGTMGIVTDVQQHAISVLFVVNGSFSEKSIDVARCDFSTRVGKTVEIIMTQYPLTLAYSATIHKVQGLTLDSVRVDASNCFGAGQLYVALSRVRKAEHLSLIAFNRKSLLVDPRAVAFETR